MGYVTTAVLAFGLGLAIGALRWRQTPEPAVAFETQGIEEHEAVENEGRAWSPRMSPQRYLYLHPDGPHAETARRMVGAAGFQ